jgi:hypothetical protein
MGAGSKRSAASSCCGIGSSSGIRDCYIGKHSLGTVGQSCNPNDSDRFMQGADPIQIGLARGLQWPENGWRHSRRLPPHLRMSHSCSTRIPRLSGEKLYSRAFETATASFSVPHKEVAVRSAANIETAITAPRHTPNSSSRSRRGTGCPPSTAYVISRSGVTWSPLVPTQPICFDAASYNRSHSARREPSRVAGLGTNQVAHGCQSQNRKGARPRRATHAARPRRRGD